jgi:16S rRNA (uracil1498-N3)-methyltransferase
MQLFYAYEANETDAFLSGEEARHCSKVLRKHTGDKIHFTDGKGSMFEGEIISSTKDSVHLSIISKQTTFKEHGLIMAVSPLKNPDRYEWLVEKLVEIGVDRIIPILCQRTEKNFIRKDRLEKIALSSMKQSLKANLPAISDPLKFDQCIEMFKGYPHGKWCATIPVDLNQNIFKLHTSGMESIVLIGPEGDFSLDEINLAKQEGFKLVSLGNERLRTETAGVVAATLIMAKNNMNL